MNLNVRTIEETTSTNDYVRQEMDLAGADAAIVFAQNQTAGRGQGGNRWLTEPRKNIAFSLRFRPEGLMAEQQFGISMAAAVALAELLEEFSADVSIKWPNDIYVGERKIAGMLIENTLRGKQVEESVVGIGINVNQTAFPPELPNPVSIAQIAGEELDTEFFGFNIVDRFSTLVEEREYLPSDELAAEYHSRLFRREGFHEFSDKDGPFAAQITRVNPDGRIVLTDTEGRERTYGFREVEHL